MWQSKAEANEKNVSKTQSATHRQPKLEHDGTHLHQIIAKRVRRQRVAVRTRALGHPPQHRQRGGVGVLQTLFQRRQTGALDAEHGHVAERAHHERLALCGRQVAARQDRGET